MKTALIYDTETTGLDPIKDSVIEVGCVLYDLEHATIRECVSTTIRAAGNAAEPVNRIPAASLVDAREPVQAWNIVANFAKRADAFVAHSADFDRSFTPQSVARMKPWICSCHDVDWSLPGSQSAIDGPRSRPGRSLVALALEHGLGVSSAHRAIVDCLLLARLFERVQEQGRDLRAMLVRGLRPKGRFIVADTTFDAARNALAKQHGFQWKDPFWERTMAIEDASALPFAVLRQEAA